MFCSQFGTNLAPILLIMIVAEDCLVLSLPAESYNLLEIYWSVPYWDILPRVENLKCP